MPYLRTRRSLLLRLTLGAVAALPALMASSGCTDKLETGYEPKKLGVSPAARRAYYASPFTPEAAAAQQERNDDRPMTGAAQRPGR